MLVNIVGVAVHPLLTDHVDTVWPAICARSKVGVAHSALGDFGRITLQSDGIDVVIGLERGELRMRRAVARRAEYRSVPGAVTIEISTLHRHIGVGGEGLILRLAPLTALSKCGFVAQAIVVAHLAGGFNEPAGASWIADMTDIAVAAGAVDLVHGSTLAQGFWAWMANVASGQVGLPLIQGSGSGIV